MTATVLIVQVRAISVGTSWPPALARRGLLHVLGTAGVSGRMAKTATSSPHKSSIPPGKPTALGERVVRGFLKTVDPNRRLTKKLHKAGSWPVNPWPALVSARCKMPTSSTT